MDLRDRLGMSGFPAVIRKAQELERLSKVQFDASAFGLVSIFCVSLLYPSRSLKSHSAIYGFFIHKGGGLQGRLMFRARMFSVSI